MDYTKHDIEDEDGQTKGSASQEREQFAEPSEASDEPESEPDPR